MDERIARITTAEKARIFASNAKRSGDLDAEAKALERASYLQAQEEGFSTPAEIAIARALYAYEEQQAKVSGKSYYANRTRKMFRDHGTLMAVEKMVLRLRPSTGYTVLEEAGLGSHSFEAIVHQYPEEFSANAIRAARARLRNEEHDTLGEAVSGSVNLKLSSPSLDEEAKLFIQRFKEPENRFQCFWKPHYLATLATVREAVEGGQVANIVDLIWKDQDNYVSNAGQGNLGSATINALRGDLEALTQKISVDPSVVNYQRVIKELEGWRSRGLIKKLPKLLISRAFAALHPSRYHTLVAEDKQSRTLEWFEVHTGFSIPIGGWAHKSQALVTHLNEIAEFGDEDYVRNMFPWFVFEQMRDADQRPSFSPGHKVRPPDTSYDLPASTRDVLLRHNLLQAHLFQMLSDQYGEVHVGTEQATGSGGYADALVRLGDKCFLYEIKISLTAAGAVREALGQLLEYAYRPTGFEPDRMIIVAEPPLDALTKSFLGRLNTEFRMKLEYLQVTLPSETM